MKIIAKRNVQLRGHVYSKGEAAEWNGPIDGRIAALFTAADGSELTVGGQAEHSSAINAGGKQKGGEQGDAGGKLTEEERVAKIVNTLGRQGIAQKLDELGVNCPPNMKTDALAKLLLQQQGELG